MSLPPGSVVTLLVQACSYLAADLTLQVNAELGAGATFVAHSVRVLQCTVRLAEPSAGAAAGPAPTAAVALALLVGQQLCLKLARPFAALPPDHQGWQGSAERYLAWIEANVQQQHEIMSSVGASSSFICRSYAVGHVRLAPDASGATPALLTELAAGGSVDQRLPGTARPLPPSEVPAVLSQAARGLADLHAAGYAFLDLKPANIVVMAEPNGAACGSYKLVDLGSAVRLGQAACVTVDVVDATAAYAAPEVPPPRLLISRAADVWALGMLVLELRTGWTPLPHLAKLSLADAVPRRTFEEVQRYRSYAGKLTPQDLAFLQRCLVTDWQQRPSMSEAAELVKQLV